MKRGGAILICTCDTGYTHDIWAEMQGRLALSGRHTSTSTTPCIMQVHSPSVNGQNGSARGLSSQPARAAAMPYNSAAF